MYCDSVNASNPSVALSAKPALLEPAERRSRVRHNTSVDAHHAGLDSFTEHLRTLTALMRAEADNEGSGSSAILSSLCDVLFALTLRQVPSRELHPHGLWTAIDDSRLRLVIEDVVREPGHPWTILELAERATMSRATFIRRFTKAVGTSFGTFLTRTRMLTASQLLAETNKPISEVAEAVGFASESSSGRASRAATATTPARFRRTANGPHAPRQFGSP